MTKRKRPRRQRISATMVAVTQAAGPSPERRQHGALDTESVVVEGQRTRLTRYRAARRARLLRLWAGVHYGALLRYEELVERAGLDYVGNVLREPTGSDGLVSEARLRARGRLRRVRAHVRGAHLQVIDRLLFGAPVTGDFETVDAVAAAFFGGRLERARQRLALEVRWGCRALAEGFARAP